MADEPVKNKTLQTAFKIGIICGVLTLFIYGLYVFLNSFFAPLKVSLGYINNSTVTNSLINNSNTYLALLQELVISASMIFGLYTALFFYFLDHIIEFADTYSTGIFDKIFTRGLPFIFTLVPFILIFLSAFYSVTATMIYGTQNNYSTIDARTSVHTLFSGTGLIIANLIAFLVERLWLSTLPKKYHGFTIFIFIWYALILLVLLALF